MLLLVDALDEAWIDTGTALPYLLSRLTDVSTGLRILATTRDDPRFLKFFQSIRSFDLLRDVSLSVNDIRAYATQRLTSLDLIPEVKRAHFGQRLAKHADGIFLYAVMVLDELATRPMAALADLDRFPLPVGLSGLYHEFLNRELGVNEQRWFDLFEPVLGLIAVAQGEGLTAQQLTSILNKDVRAILRAIKQYLTGELPDGPFRLFHKSFADFLLADDKNTDYPIDAQAMNQRIAEYCSSVKNNSNAVEDDPANLDRYNLKYLVVHLLAAGRAQEAAEKLLNPAFLEAKAEANLVYDLPRELERVANELDPQSPKVKMLLFLREAIQNSVSFVAEHPESLFECLWNSCWWYDSEEGAYHYVKPNEGWPEGETPWLSSTTNLAPTMEYWRVWKEQRSPGFRWIRSLRPPPMRLGSALLTVLSGAGPGTGKISVSTDNRVVSSSSDGIRVFDLDSGRQLLLFPRSDYKSESVAFTPDAVHVISGGGPMDPTVRIWNSRTGEQIAELRGHKYIVESVVVSQDGRKFVTGSWDKTVRVWDLRTRVEIRSLLGHEGPVKAVDISPDSTKIASAGDDGTIRVWDAETGIALQCLKSGYAGSGWNTFLNTVRFSPDGRQIVSGGNDKFIRLWNVELGVQVAAFGSDGGNIKSALFTPDGRKVIAGLYDGTVRVWSLSGEQLARHEGHEGGVLCVDLTADGKKIVSVDEHDTIRAWAIEGSSFTPKLYNHESGVQVVRFSPDGKWLVSGSWDGSIIIWDARNGRPMDGDAKRASDK